MTIFGIMQSNSFHFIFFLRTLNMHLSTSSLANYVLVAKLVCSDEPTAILRLYLVRVKVFLENISFSKNVIFRKGKYIQVFGCVEIRFTENQFRCLVRTNILRKINSHVCFHQAFYGKWNSFIYRKSFLMFGLWIILQKITISSTCIT